MNDIQREPPRPETARLILAPLRGFTPHVFRAVYQRHFKGIQEAVAPFIPTVSVRRVTSVHLRDVLPELNRAMPVIPQLLSNSADDFLLMTRHLEEWGYDTVNWNLGCPFPAVAKKGRGSGMLAYPDRVDAFLDRCVPASPLRISVKIRLGWASASDILELMPILNRYPLREVILHPRTGTQRYDGVPDLDAFAWCLNECRHPMVYNGDITDREGFFRLRNRFPDVTRWMLGRGVLANPFLPELLASGENPPDQRERFRRFHADLLDAYIQEFSGPGHPLERMKGYWLYFSQGFPGGNKVLKKIQKSRHLEAYRDIVEGFLDGLPTGLSLDPGA